MEAMATQFFNLEIMEKALPIVFMGLRQTILLCLVVIPLGLAGGLLFALLSRSRILGVRWAAAIIALRQARNFTSVRRTRRIASNGSSSAGRATWARISTVTVKVAATMRCLRYSSLCSSAQPAAPPALTNCSRRLSA